MMILSVIILSVLHLAFSSTIDVYYESNNCLTESSSYAANSTFQRNLNYTLFTQLVANASLHAPSSTYEAGEGYDRVFAFYYCRPDLGAQVCHSCVANAATKVIARCNLLKQGIVWYDECSLCYGGNSSVFTNNYEDVNYPKYNSTPDLGDYLEQYRNLYNSTITDLIDQAAHNVSLSFATKTVNLSSSQSLRGIVQCGPIISGESCKECLNAAYVKMTQEWTNTMMFLPACYVGFELYGSRPPLLPLSSSSTLSVRSKVLIALLCPVGILLLLGCGFWFWKHKHPFARDSLIQDNVELIESERQLGLVQYSYYQLEDMTSGFKKKLGEGGFATVYYGCLSDGSNEVAVKVFSKQEAPNQFSTEINVLGGISHKNLVSLIGYCEDGTILALIYEFMARGDLKSLLFEQSEVLSWRKRLDIAIDVAQGLDYLHNGCCPAIVHRDVKPANILLNNKLRAKVADFGFSKIFPTEYVSNLQTRVVGTPGYLDPQYNLTGQLNEKGDVYSYGVVLLELITGKPAIVLGGTHLGVWVKSMLERGDIVSILDARLRQDVDDDYVTVWKTVELAARCIEIEGADRPKMAQIVTELKECWNSMNAQISSSATNSTETMSGAVYSSSSVISPSPR